MQNQPIALVIEDAAEIAAIFGEILEMHGASVEIIGDGAVALERLAATTPALVFLDLHLPNVSGVEILHHIRQDVRLQATKVVVITANTLLGGYLEDKPDMVLFKPVGFNQINAVAAQMLSA